MRHAELTLNDKVNAAAQEVILILPLKEARALVEMAEAAVKAQPRKTSWKAMLKALNHLPCWTC